MLPLSAQCLTFISKGMVQIYFDGRLGKDAEVRILETGKKVLNLLVAASNYVKGEEKTLWFDVVCFDEATISALAAHLTKGRYIFIAGDYDENTVEKNGKTFVNRNVRANTIKFLSSGAKKEDDATKAATATASAAQPASVAPTYASSAPTYAPNTPPPTTAPTQVYTTPAADDNGEDDLPF